MSQVRRTIVLLLLVLTIMPTALHAAVIEGFYRVEIPAREERDRAQALREAFELMVVRQAGSEALGNEAVQAAMQDPRAYMQRIAGTDAGGVRVEFEPASIRDLLMDAGLPMLGPNRPTVMLWAVEESAMGHDLLSQSSDWTSVLSQAAERRAVALSLPLADLEDRALVDVQHVLQADGEILKRASERYDASAVLALAIGEGSVGPVLDWNWWLDEQSHNGRIAGESAASAADKLMLAVSDRVVEQYAVAPANLTESSDWQVVVEGVNSVDEFAALQRTLQQLGGKQPPRVLSVKGDEVRLVVEFPGTEAQLERLLALDHRLRRMPEPKQEETEPQVGGRDQDPSPLDGSDGEAGRAAVADDGPTDQENGVPLVAEPDVAPPEPQAAPKLMYFRWR